VNPMSSRPKAAPRRGFIAWCSPTLAHSIRMSSGGCHRPSNTTAPSSACN
jgi:hypothetical protein